MFSRFKGILLFAVTMSLFSCTSHQEETENKAENSQILTMTIGASPPTLDPHQATDTASINVIAALSENLVRLNYQTLEIMPGIAERWEVLDDGLRYRFYLREDARWSNGASVTAQDFVYSWQRMLAPNLGNQYATDYFCIKNAEAYVKGEINKPSALGVKALSHFVLEFTLVRRNPVFLKLLTQPQTSPVLQAVVEKYGAMDAQNNTWIRSGHHVGNGPFMLVNWELNKIIEVKKNPYYWDSDNVLLDAIKFDPSETESAEERLFRSGQVQLTFGRRIPTEKLATYREKQPELLFSQVDYATYFYLFNTQKPPFNNVDVRRAFTYAVDREMIVQHITKNNEKVANALSPMAGNYVPPQISSYNPDKAREYLAKAGFANGVGFPKIALMYNTADMHRNIAVAIQQMWKKELNVNVTLENQEWKVFLSTRQGKNFDVARAGSSSGIADPIDFLSSFTTGHGMNDAAWANPEYDRLIDLSNQAVDEKERFELLYQAEAILLDQLPMLPIFYYNSSYLKSTRVKGFNFNMLAQPNYKGVYIDMGTTNE